MVWVEAPGFPMYQVSHDGRVRNSKTRRALATRFVKGYRYVNMYQPYPRRRLVQLSRLVLAAFVGVAPPGHTADHVRSWRKDNDDYRNLRWATRTDQNLNRRPTSRTETQTSDVVDGEIFRPALQKDGSEYTSDPGVDVSNMGRVRRRTARRSSMRLAGDFLTPRGRADGEYPIVTVLGKKRRVHDLVALAFLGPRPPGCVVNHKNHVKTDASVENLEYATWTKNTAAALAAGRYDHAKTKPIPVTLAGVRYTSMTAASKATGIPVTSRDMRDLREQSRLVVPL